LIHKAHSSEKSLAEENNYSLRLVEIGKVYWVFPKEQLADIMRLCEREEE